MKKIIFTVIGCLALMTGVAWSQEVVITEFPIGVAGSVDAEFLKPHYPQIQAIAEAFTLK